ncbi:hypothetical protein D3C80_1212380 [compost metagenome]
MLNSGFLLPCQQLNIYRLAFAGRIDALYYRTTNEAKHLALKVLHCAHQKGSSFTLRFFPPFAFSSSGSGR